MKRRELLRGIGAASTITAVGTASAAETTAPDGGVGASDCDTVYENPDCILSSCYDWCPPECCRCAC